ncbi:MAG TPA: hypothetical protein VIW93_13230 [Candidatus Acidoferrum sp.]
MLALLAVAAGRVFALIVESAVGAAAPSAVFSVVIGLLLLQTPVVLILLLLKFLPFLVLLRLGLLLLLLVFLVLLGIASVWDSCALSRR